MSPPKKKPTPRKTPSISTGCTDSSGCQLDGRLNALVAEFRRTDGTHPLWRVAFALARVLKARSAAEYPDEFETVADSFFTQVGIPPTDGWAEFERCWKAIRFPEGAWADAVPDVRPAFHREAAMATLFKPDRPYPVPAGAEVADRDGKPHVRVKERGKAVWYPLTGNGRQYMKPAAKWAADVRFADGRRKRVRFSPNRDAAAVMLADLLKRIEQEKAGVIDHTSEHAKRPLSSHMSDWLASLRANGGGAEYVALKAARVQAVIDGCGWVFPGSLSADRLETFLADLRKRRPDLPAVPSGVEWFTMRDVRKLLGGVSRQTVATLIRAGGHGRRPT